MNKQEEYISINLYKFMWNSLYTFIRYWTYDSLVGSPRSSLGQKHFLDKFYWLYYHNNKVLIGIRSLHSLIMISLFFIPLSLLFFIIPSWKYCKPGWIGLKLASWYVQVMQSLIDLEALQPTGDMSPVCHLHTVYTYKCQEESPTLNYIIF